MVTIKNKREIDLMRKAGYIAAQLLEVAEKAVEPGITTKQLDTIIRKFITSNNAKPSFLGYNGFPASACISINDVVIHGIPSERRIENGDIVSIDVGVLLNGYHADTARTFIAGDASEEAKKLVQVTKECFYEGFAQAVAGNRLGDIGYAIERHAVNNGYSVVHDYVGHGIGTRLHEDPSVPNYGLKGKGLRLASGMTLAIEPMINQGVAQVQVLKDGWTVVTKDGKLSAHYENTIAVTDDEPLILTSL